MQRQTSPVRLKIQITVLLYFVMMKSTKCHFSLKRLTSKDIGTTDWCKYQDDLCPTPSRLESNQSKSRVCGLLMIVRVENNSLVFYNEFCSSRQSSFHNFYEKTSCSDLNLAEERLSITVNLYFNQMFFNFNQKK